MTIITNLKSFCLLVLLYGICCFGLPPAYAQSNPNVSIHPYAQNDTLKLEIRFRALFEGNIKKTLLAGLPVLLELDLRLVDSQNKSVHSKKLGGEITYDVWEELFKIEGFDSVLEPLHSLDEVKQFFNDHFRTTLLPIEYLMSAEKYHIDAESRLTLLTRKQSRELQDWIKNSDQTEEDLPTQERDTGFRLNLNKVVQLFVGKQDKQERFIFKASSGEFRLHDL